MIQTQIEYRTKDLPSASFLVAIGKKLKNVDREYGKCWFVFDDKVSCEKLVKDFYFGSSYEQMKLFYDAMQALKHQIFT